MASGLGVKLQDLVIPIRTLTGVQFRALKKMNSRESILADVARWLEDFNYLENSLNDHKDYLLKDFSSSLSSVQRNKRAKYTAEKARERFKLNEKEPIHDIAGLLESCAIKVYPVTLVSDGFFGLSVCEEDGGPAVIVNA